MGISERREREKEQRRQEIINAAEKVFFSKGLHPATMDDVANEAELSKGTLYLYFKSKEEIFYAINCRGLNILIEMFKKVTTEKSTGRDKLNAIGRAYFEFAKKYTDYFNSMTHGVSHEMDHDEKHDYLLSCHNMGNEAMQIVADAVRAGLVDGSIKTDIDPIKLAVILWGQTTGVIQIIALQKKHIKKDFTFDSDELIEDMFQIIGQMLSYSD